MVKVAIVVIGDELLIGQVADTNSKWLAQNITSLGWQVLKVITVGDNAADIKASIESALQIADIVITTGGLGPTKDDITKSTLMQVFGGHLVHDKTSEINVQRIVDKLGFKINELTAAQADVPSSCKVIQNEVGTAPIMWFERDGKVLVSMPGVPYETETMMQRKVFPALRKHFGCDGAVVYNTFIVVNNTESGLATRLTEFEDELPDYIKLAYLPTPGVVRLRLTAITDSIDEARSEISILSDKLKSILGNDIISCKDEKIEEILGKLLKEKGYTLSTAESCTGGNIAHVITTVPGSSEYFNGGVVSYSNEIKMKVLNVDAACLSSFGAVSKETVEQMIKGVVNLLGTDCAIATSGIAGPGGGTDEKPVGTVWIAVTAPNGTENKCFKIPGSRQRVIERATTYAIIMLINKLINI